MLIGHDTIYMSSEELFAQGCFMISRGKPSFIDHDSPYAL